MAVEGAGSRRRPVAVCASESSAHLAFATAEPPNDRASAEDVTIAASSQRGVLRAVTTTRVISSGAPTRDQQWRPDT